MNRRTILVWFRNDLRINDNEMLSMASERSVTIVPVYLFDPRLFAKTRYGSQKTGIQRARFIHESVLELQHSIRLLGGELIVKVGFPEEILPELAKEHEVDEVYHHREVASEETHISANVEEALWKLKLNLRHFIGHTLYHKEDLPFPIKDIPDEFNVFKKKTARESEIRPSVSNVNGLRFLGDISAYELPALEDLGYRPDEIQASEDRLIRGGEAEAEKRLALMLEGSLFSDVDSGLSPWLSVGCLSVHTLYHAISNHSEFPKSILNAYLDELWWHDYYRFMFKKHGNRFFGIQGFAETLPHYDGGEEQFNQWKEGQTESDEINRIMHSLNQSGYINYQQQIEAASFLVHELDVEWLLGAAYFEEKLLDYNPSTNYGRWAHVAGVGSSSRHNRVKLDKSS